jgi:hypothetical protein
MIVDPDFFEHWRTRMVVNALAGDELAPVYIMRMWAHCQTRKSDRFKMPSAGLKAQCRYAGDADLFEQAMSEAGFVKREGDEILVVGWAEQNASLIAAWENGAKGGRPKKEAPENPQVTHGKPNGNPSLTQTKPIREDKSREDKKEPVPLKPDVEEKPSTDRRSLPHREDCIQVFGYWQRVMDHPKSKLDAQKIKALKARFKDGYTVGDLCRAIDGCRADPWHMGKNDRSNVVDGLHYICRDGPNVEKFMAIAERGPPTGRTANAQQTIDNLQAYLAEHEN